MHYQESTPLLVVQLAGAIDVFHHWHRPSWVVHIFGFLFFFYAFWADVPFAHYISQWDFPLLALGASLHLIREQTSRYVQVQHTDILA